MWTQGILIAPHVCCLLPLPSALMLVGISLWSYAEIHALWRADWVSEPGEITLVGAYYFGGIAIYAIAAYFLTRGAFRQFDAVADRPRRPPQDKVVLVAWQPALDKDQADAGNELP